MADPQTTKEPNFEGQVLFYLKVIYMLCLATAGGVAGLAVGMGDLPHGG